MCRIALAARCAHALNCAWAAGGLYVAVGARASAVAALGLLCLIAAAGARQGRVGDS